MARPGLEEAIRIVLDTEGVEGVEALRAALANVGDSSGKSAEKAGELAKELEKLANTSTNIRNFTRLKATLADTGVALEKAEQRLSELNAEMASSESPSRRLTQATERAAHQVDRLTKLQNRQRAELTRTTNALNKAGIDTDNLGRAYGELQGELVRVGAGADNAARGLRKVGRESNSVDTSARKSATAISRISASLIKVSGAAATAAAALAAVATAGAGAFFSGAIRSATTLEDALTEVKAVTGATAEEMVALKAAAEAGASSTRFTSLQAAQGLGELARATGTARDAIASLPAALNLAQAAGLDVAAAAQFITTTLTQFGLGAEQASRVADVLAKAANATTTDVRQLGDALTYAAPLAKQLGLDTEDTVAILGELADQGFRGERAGTALRNVFSELLEPSSAFAKAIRDLGIESGDFATIIEQLGKSGDRGREALQLLDAAARPAILSLVNEGGAGLRQLEADLRNAAGAAEETARQMGQSTSASAEAVGKSLDRIRRSLVEPILEPLRGELTTLAAELEAFAQSPEFEEIKVALTELFTEGAAAARELLQEIDFKALARDIRDFVNDADQSLAEFRENISLIVDAVEVIGDVFSVTFNAVQTVVLGAAAAVAKFLENILRAQQKLAELPRKAVELLGLSTEGFQQLDDAVGGLGAVYDEFASRAGKNLHETIEATKDLVGANEEAGNSSAHLRTYADATKDAAAAASQQAAAARDAAAAVEGQAEATAAAAVTTGTAASQMEAGAQRLKQAFADLGIQSQESLQRSAESARRNFELIRKAVGEGKATAEDARRALAAYAQAARAAVADSDASTRSRVENELAVYEAIYQVTGALDQAGRAGTQAGREVAAGAQQATSALEQTAAAADRVATAQDGVASASSRVADGASSAANAASGLSFSLGEISDKAWEAIRALSASQDPLARFGQFARDLSDQRKQLVQLTENAKDAAAEFDELNDRRRELRSQFSLLGDSEIDALVQAEQRVTQLQQQRRQAREQEEERQRQIDLKRIETLKEANELATTGGNVRIPISDNKLTVELVYPRPAAGGELSPDERRTADRMLRYLLPRIVQELGRMKAVSIHQRPR